MSSFKHQDISFLPDTPNQPHFSHSQSQSTDSASMVNLSILTLVIEINVLPEIIFLSQAVKVTIKFLTLYE